VQEVFLICTDVQKTTAWIAAAGTKIPQARHPS
jgi:hypothetical protein